MAFCLGALFDMGLFFAAFLKSTVYFLLGGMRKLFKKLHEQNIEADEDDERM